MRVNAVAEGGAVITSSDFDFEVRVVSNGNEPLQNIVLNDYPYEGYIAELNGREGEMIGVYITVVSSGEAIAGSPFVLEVEGGDMWIYVVVGISGGLLALFSLLTCAVLRKSHNMQKVAFAKIRQEHSDLQDQMLEMERAVVETTTDRGGRESNIKPHSEGEMLVMQKAMDELEQSRRNEMVSVMIPSKDIKLDKVVGRGGFGIVYKGALRGKGSKMVQGIRMSETSTANPEEVVVALKQLISIDDNSVERFRFECFLMKELRHANICSFVGICWDERMLACVTEYVENGTLEDHLRRSCKFSDRNEWLDVAVLRGYGQKGVNASDLEVECKKLARQWRDEAEGGQQIHSWEKIVHAHEVPDENVGLMLGTVRKVTTSNRSNKRGEKVSAVGGGVNLKKGLMAKGWMR